MIPPFNEDGFLPPGVHSASLDEIDERFGQLSEIRSVQMDSVRWMVELSGQAGGERVVLNGNFTTDIMEPNDVDCVLLFLPGRYRDQSAIQQLRGGLPFLELKLVGQEDFDDYLNAIFATDRMGVLKGMIEVIL